MVHSTRFNKDVIVTNHARERMTERGIDDPTLLDVICAAAVEEAYLVIKTVLVNWTLREEP